MKDGKRLEVLERIRLLEKDDILMKKLKLIHQQLL